MRIFVFCDGTGQNAVVNKEPTEDTNVQRFKQCVSVPGSPDQHIYVPGVGTHAPENAGAMPLSRAGDLGYQASGSDVHSIIRRLYFGLCEKYDSNPDAEIHLIGFSRGAFTVRCLACLIEDMGLLKEDYRSKDYQHIYNMWRVQDVKAFEMINWTTKKRHERAFWPVQIASCGVWDTVSALRHPITLLPSDVLSFVSHRVPKNLGFAFQALALHEQRYKYNPILWKQIPDSKTCVRQCWFAGDHSDIGGGWPDCGLANLTLIWMLAQYEKYFSGMVINHDRLYRRLCPPGAGPRYLSHTLSQGNVHHYPLPPDSKDGIGAREDILRQDAGTDGKAPFQNSHQQTIHFTVRLFLAKHREEVTMSMRDMTRSHCLPILTTGYTELQNQHDADQSLVRWVVMNSKKNRGEKEKGKRMKTHCSDTLVIMENETTKWESDIINTWTAKAQQLVDKNVDNIFEKGVREYDMTTDKLVRGYKHNKVDPKLTVHQLLSRNKDLSPEEACKIVIDRAWHCSLEYFLRKNRNQATCEARKKLLYLSYIKHLITEMAWDDPHYEAVNPGDGNLSDGPPLETRLNKFEKAKLLRRLSSALSGSVDSYPGQGIFSTASSERA